MRKILKLKAQIVILVAVFLIGCDGQNKLEDLKKTYPVVETVTAVDGSDEREIRLYIIDSCEYIGYVNIFNSDILTHKGNCKFCLKRNSK